MIPDTEQPDPILADEYDQIADHWEEDPHLSKGLKQQAARVLRNTAASLRSPGRPREIEGAANVQITLSAGQREKLAAYCQKEGISRSEVIRRLIEAL